MMHEQIKKEIPEALRAGDTDRLKAARNLSAALTNELVAKGKKPDELLADDEVLAVIKRLAKQRRDSIQQFREGDREELAAAEEKELSYLEKFLPEEMSEEEIRTIAEKKKGELGITDKAGIGALMGAVMKEVKGRADGGRVKKVVEGVLS